MQHATSFEKVQSLDSQEVFEEIVSLLHCYAMKMYSSRKRKVVEELVSVSAEEDEVVKRAGNGTYQGKIKGF
jgi:predicted site-specific integrase-resolvase